MEAARSISMSTSIPGSNLCMTPWTFRTCSLTQKCSCLRRFTHMIRSELDVLKSSLPDESLRSLWNALDADASGTLSYGEFAHFMRYLSKEDDGSDGAHSGRVSPRPTGTVSPRPTGTVSPRPTGTSTPNRSPLRQQAVRDRSSQPALSFRAERAAAAPNATAAVPDKAVAKAA